MYDTIIGGVEAVLLTAIGLYGLYNVAAILAAIATWVGHYKPLYRFQTTGVDESRFRPGEPPNADWHVNGIWSHHVIVWYYLLLVFAVVVAAGGFFWLVGAIRELIQGAMI